MFLDTYRMEARARPGWLRPALDTALYVVTGFCLLYLYDYVTWTHQPLGAAFLNLGRGAVDQLLRLEPPSLVALEYPIVLVTLLCLYFPRLGNPWIKYLLPALPVAIAFAVIDGFFQFLARMPHPSDISTVGELYAVSKLYGIGAAAFLLAAPATVLYLFARARRDCEPAVWRRSILLRLTVLVGGATVLLSPSIFPVKRHIVVMPWSEQFTAQSNGRLASFFYYAQRETINRRALAAFSDFGDIGASLYPGQPKQRRNIYVIALESFVDPRLFRNVAFNRSPLSDQLKPFLLDGGTGFSRVVSPVYGGNTARPCFELISGLPSLGLVDPIEFNMMTGGRVRALPHILKENGYDTQATIATSSEFFNEPRAYRSLSVDRALFLGNRDSGFVKHEGDNEIFDGDLYDLNLERIKRHLDSSDRPLFNYVLGMYGHHPFTRNLDRHPDIITAPGSAEDVRRIANQFHYRTLALARYLQRLKAIDSEAIVVVSSDHLPPVLGKSVEYEYDRHVNSALFLDAFRPINVTGRRQHELPWLVWDLLRGEGGGRRDIAPAEMERLYYTALRQSVEAE